MGEDAAELALVEDLEDPLRHRDRRVLGVPPGRKRVRLSHVGDVDRGHRKVAGLRELPDDPVELGRLLLGHRLRLRGRDRDPRGVPVHREVEDERQTERDEAAARPSDRVADQHEQSAERRDQDPGLGAIDADHRVLLSAPEGGIS